MDINLTTPALLFPTVSLLMLAYTNRFLTLATIIRGLYDRYNSEKNQNLLGQITNLRYRVYLIRNMQIFGVLSLLMDTLRLPDCLYPRPKPWHHGLGYSQRDGPG